MWQCVKCQYKNNNTSERCHGKNCDGIKEKDLIKTPQTIVKKEKKVKRVYDFCPACGKDMFFTPTRWKGKTGYWSCESKSHRPCVLKGKSKPFPTIQPLTVPEDTWDGAN